MTKRDTVVSELTHDDLAQLTPADETDLVDTLAKCESALAWCDQGAAALKHGSHMQALECHIRLRKELMGAIVRLRPIVTGEA